jgi:hypothetical protein
MVEPDRVELSSPMLQAWRSPDLSYDPFFFFLLCFFRLPFFHHFLGLCGGRKCKIQHPSWQVETELHTRRLHIGHVSRIRRAFVGRMPRSPNHAWLQCSLCSLGKDSVFATRSDPGQIVYLFISHFSTVETGVEPVRSGSKPDALPLRYSTPSL